MKHAFVAALAVAGSVALAAAGPRTFDVDPQQSQASIAVGKTGAFSFAGHTHDVDAPLTSGVVHLDPDNPSRSDVRLEFNAGAMRVTGTGEPPGDVPKVTETMLGARVLDVKAFPTIVFESTSVTAKGAPPSLRLAIAGRLTIHGVTKAVTAPVDVTVRGATLTAAGRFAIRQTDFGITPISIGGVVKVKDELTITFTIAARER